MPDENPYAGRSHEDGGVDTGDVHSIAALVGNVSGQLKDIDKKIVGGQNNQYTQALKMNPTQAVKSIIGSAPHPPVASPPPPEVAPSTQPAVVSPNRPAPPPPPEQPDEIVNVSSLEKRIEKLERDICNYNKSFKFKRGISYNLNTSSIKGNFKNPDDIIDVVLSELAKNAKTITIKLEDANKVRK